MSTIRERNDGYGMLCVALVLAALALMLGTGCEGLSVGGEGEGDTTVTVVVTNPVTQAPITVNVRQSDGAVVTVGNNNRPNVDNSQRTTTPPAAPETPAPELVPVEQ